jgi:hypothetical protein
MSSAPSLRPFYREHEGRWRRRLHQLLADAAFLASLAALWAWARGAAMLPAPARSVAAACLLAELLFFVYGKFRRARLRPPPLRQQHVQL